MAKLHRFGWVFTPKMKDVKEVEITPKAIVFCRDCIHFMRRDYWTDFHGVPVLGADNQPTCTKWGEGDCITSEDGFYFLGEAVEGSPSTIEYDEARKHIWIVKEEAFDGNEQDH